MSPFGERLMAVYERLFVALGPQGWWPAEDDFEMVVGAILTQSTAWVNVEKAIANLKMAGLLGVQALTAAPVEGVAETIRPSGYFNVKARKLKSFCRHLESRHGGRLESLFHVKLPGLRDELLGIWGVGAETADSIALYGARQPVFVVDAYTRRIFGRLGLSRPESGYDELQRLFMEALPPSVELFQEYHALIVALGKGICRPRPLCGRCPLRDLCSEVGRSPQAAVPVS
jgi:endonuclease III related protein